MSCRYSFLYNEQAYGEFYLKILWNFYENYSKKHIFAKNRSILD
jgi:hypothetical protein